MPVIATPAAVRQADELLPAARRLIDEFSDGFVGAPELDVSCKAGCSACCSQPVPVTPAEVRSIIDAIDSLDAERQREIRRQIARTDAALAAAGIDEDTFTAVGDDPAARARAVHEYFVLDLPCPLLKDGVCSLRDDRPLACREYLVSSDPVHCTPEVRRASVGKPSQVVRIRAKTDVIGGFHEISAAFGEERLSILAFALARPPAAPLPSEPRSAPRSGPRLAQHLTQPRRF